MLVMDKSFRSRWWYALLLMRLHRPVGILLLLWPTLIALWLAGNGQPSWHLVLIFTLGVIVMRSAGCVINDWADRDVDGKVQRTKERPLIAQLLKPKDALWLFAGLLLLAFILVLNTNALTIKLSFGALILATLYPFMKRYTHFPQVVLGAAFGWAVPMAYAAQTQTLPLDCWILYAATLLWTVAYDTAYGMADKADDIVIQVKSTAIFFGKYDKLMIFLLQMLSLGLFWIIGKRLALSTVYTITLVLAFLLMIYQQWLMRHRDPKACIEAFLNNQWLGALLFVGVVLGV